MAIRTAHNLGASLRTLFAAAMLLCLAAPAFAVNRVDLLVGFFPAKTNDRARRIDLGEDAYYLDMAAMPTDRLQIRKATHFYVDRFPDKGELFRDDMEAFHKMLFDGGLLVLLCGPDSSANSLKNMNYLGTRFEFQFAERATPGEMIPKYIGQGPFAGNVWMTEKGTRPLVLQDPEWVVLFQTPGTREPVVAVRKIGQGMLMILGTTEVERVVGSKRNNSLTLVDWGRRAMKLPLDSLKVTPPPSETPMAAASTTPAPVGVAEMQRIIENPRSDLLIERMADMRRAYRLANEPVSLVPLTPAEQRPFFPAVPGLVDGLGNPFDIRDHTGSVVLVVLWASWDEASKSALKAAAPVLEEARTKGMVTVGVSLDVSRESMDRFQRENGLGWRSVCDGMAFETPMAKTLNTTTLPRFILVDKRGRIASPNMNPGDATRALETLRAE